MFAFFKSITLLSVMVVIANKIDVVKIVVRKLSKLNNNKENIYLTGILTNEQKQQKLELTLAKCLIFWIGLGHSPTKP